MSRTIRNEEKYAKKRRSEKSKLSKKYLNFKRGDTEVAPALDFLEPEPLASVADIGIEAATSQSEVAA
jgi:hypothetical protein